MTQLRRRERVQLALNHQVPDRIPMDLGSTVVTGLTLGAHQRLEKHLGLEKKEHDYISFVFQVVHPDERILNAFDVDFRPIFYRPPYGDNVKKINKRTFIDEWGIVRFKSHESLYYDIIKSPLENATIDDLKEFQLPNPLDPSRFEGQKEEAEYFFNETDFALVGPGTDTNLFELAWFLRGFENFLIDLVSNPDFVHILLSRLLEYRKLMIGRFLQNVGEYLDVIYVGDDLAIQTGPLMSIKTFREMVKPYLSEYYQFIKQRTRAKLLLHCCGNTTSLMEDFIEMGVDIINPVQVSAEGMETKSLKEKFGDRIVFWGGIDTQHVLPNGTTEDVRAEVRQRVADLGANGGYVLAAVHNIQPDVPPQNICALFDEGRKMIY